LYGGIVVSTIPLASEKILQATVKALRFGGLLSSTADVEKIFNIENDATETDIDNLLSSLSYGSFSNGDSISSDTDFTVFIDANDDDGYATQPRYFRVAQDQSSGNVTDPDKELLTVGEELFSVLPPKSVVRMSVGPRTVLGGAVNSEVACGSDGSDYLLTLYGGYGAVGGSSSGARITAKSGLDIKTTDIWIRHPSYDIAVGGWRNITSDPSTAKFIVGDYDNGNGLVLRAFDSGTSGQYYNVIEAKAGLGYPRLYVAADDPSNYDALMMLIGVQPDDPFYSDPSNYNNPTLAVIGKDSSASMAKLSPVLYLRDRANRDSNGEIFTIYTDSNTAFSWYAMRVWYGANAVFNIDNQGNVNIDSTASFNATGGDVAEIVISDDTYDPGTVMIIRNGIYTKSDTIKAKGVAGVVATQPGVVFGKNRMYDETDSFQISVKNFGDTDRLYVQEKLQIGTYVLIGTDYAEITDVKMVDNIYSIVLDRVVKVTANSKILANIRKHKHYVKLAVTGIVPTKCSTAYGNIYGNGELLMAGPDGCAVLATEPYDHTTLVGKAIGQLIQSGDQVVEGKIEVQLI